MTKKKIFLRWVLIVSLIMTGTVIAAYLGWFGVMYRFDQTKLTMIILAVFAFTTMRSGLLIWRLDDGREQLKNPAFNRTEFLKDLKIGADDIWLYKERCEYLGLIGTAFGFVLMLGKVYDSAQDFDFSLIGQMLKQGWTGLATAFITTLVGYLCSLAIGFQARLLDKALQRMKSWNDEK